MCQDLWHSARSAAEPWGTVAVVYAAQEATAFLSVGAMEWAVELPSGFSQTLPRLDQLRNTAQYLNCHPWTAAPPWWL